RIVLGHCTDSDRRPYALVFAPPKRQHDNTRDRTHSLSTYGISNQNLTLERLPCRRSVPRRLYCQPRRQAPLDRHIRPHPTRRVSPALRLSQRVTGGIAQPATCLGEPGILPTVHANRLRARSSRLNTTLLVRGLACPFLRSVYPIVWK